MKHLGQSECSLASMAICLGLILSVSSCSSTDAPSGAGASAGSAGAPSAGSGPAAAAGSAGSAGISGTSAGGSAGATSSTGGSSGANGGTAGSAGQATVGECTPPPIDAPIEKLSLTGCMSPTDVTKFAERVVPYEVNSPLWSDSAAKQRGFVIPAGKKIHIKDCAAKPSECLDAADTGKWVFPVGAVLLKNFLFNNKIVETRMFVRHDEQTWVGYSYQWDAAQKDATVLPDERRHVMVDGGSGTMVPWSYPNRVDCMKCHNAAGGFTLGPETRQMNVMVGATNQMDTFKAKDVFDTPPSAPYQTALIDPLASTPTDDAALDKAARSYLHGNCAYCHRPDNGDLGAVAFDLRFDTLLKDTKVCNSPPVKGDQGVPDSKLLVPNNPAKSVAYLRMNTLDDPGRMPQIGTYEIHAPAVKLIGDWITSIKSCPQ
ncbi:MAG TPA: hypothetical protein VFK05_24870 [Polyangiaceae bacterium]|nr:hypothetical protein [Polyangiaceae bacterium]